MKKICPNGNINWNCCLIVLPEEFKQKSIFGGRTPKVSMPPPRHSFVLMVLAKKDLLEQLQHLSVIHAEGGL